MQTLTLFKDLSLLSGGVYAGGGGGTKDDGPPNSVKEAKYGRKCFEEIFDFKKLNFLPIWAKILLLKSSSPKQILYKCLQTVIGKKS